MKYIVMNKTPYGYLSEGLEDFSYYRLDILADWFLHDVSDRISSWYDWLKDDKYVETDSNATWLEKQCSASGEKQIIFGSITHMMQNTKKGIYAPKENEVARLSMKNVFELLNSWEQLLKIRPDKIIITEEDGIYKMATVQ